MRLRTRDLAQAFLRHTSVEARCDEVDRLYLWGSYEDDVEEFEAAEKCTECGSPYHKSENHLA